MSTSTQKHGTTVVNRGMRPFTRADAERIVGVVLAGIRTTASHL